MPGTLMNELTGKFLSYITKKPIAHITETVR